MASSKMGWDKPLPYQKGFKYQCTEDFSIDIGYKPEYPIILDFLTLSTQGILTIKKGYSCDGPSGITIDTKNSMKGAFVHDALYQLMRFGLLPQSFRPIADQLAYDIWRNSGMSYVRSKIWARALKKCAAYAADPKNKRKTYYAP